MLNLQFRLAFGFSMFAKIQSPPISRLPNKILINNQILNLNQQGQFFKFYEDNHQQMNLINLTSYIRRFTDIIIIQQSLRNQQTFQHTKGVLELIQDLVETKKYLSFLDKKEDLKRCFSMQISLCAMLLQYAEENEEIRQVLLKHSQLSVKELFQNNFISLLNIMELASFLRCICSVDILQATEEEQRLYFDTFLKISYKKEDVQSLSKIFHSFSQFTQQNDKAIEKLIKGLNDQTAEFNELDVSSIFIGLKNFINIYSNVDFAPLLSKVQSEVIKNQIQLSFITIAIIFNSLEFLKTKNYQIDELFISNLEQQFASFEAKQYSLKGIQHIFHYYEKQKVQVENRPQYEQFHTLVQLNTKSDMELYTIWFQSLIICNTKTMIHLNAVFANISKNIHLLNDYSLAKIFISISHIKANLRVSQDFLTLALQHLKIIPLTIYSQLIILNASNNFFFYDQVMIIIRAQLNENNYDQQIEALCKKNQFKEALENIKNIFEIMSIHTTVKQLEESVSNLINILNAYKEGIEFNLSNNFTRKKILFSSIDLFTLLFKSFLVYIVDPGIS